MDSTGWACNVCHYVNGSFRNHCAYCGASRQRVFWMFDKPNSWRKVHVDIDRPIHQASTSVRDIKVREVKGLSEMVGIPMTVVDDSYLLASRVLGKDGE